ncbi:MULTISPECIES: ABC transporter ATP-binding protein [Enterococcus]|nr:ABC transporter ATP-binding protein [Enterococcus avium]HAP3021761.1 ABC transporter ATP-binding protein [Enterococcus faecalis]AYQ24144.1 ABC transporter [Enterococcus avium]HBI1562649.1 ABC transporter ATP-binding protein [Enterococcus faecalis]HBI1565789.1 ABC transporter ATP-binding protein [Enterococcus faecalis]HBI1718060.1 ABC transporter ATP-binding protein [Enterococcus faecalis]
MAKILEINIDKFSYGGEITLKDIRLDVLKGECLVITGLSGSGKSTLLRLVNKLIPEVYEGDLKGNIKLLARPLESYSPGEPSKYIGNVFQDLNNQFFADIVKNEVSLVGENMGMERGLLHEKVDQSLESLNIKNLRNRKLRSLSGGQKQKVGLASTLVYDSPIIILDEPSSSLDYRAIEDLRENLLSLKEQGKTLIVVDHRLYYLMDLVDRLIVLKDGEISNIYFPNEFSKKVQEENNLRAFYEEDLQAEQFKLQENPSLNIQDVVIQNKGYVLQGKHSFSLAKGECMALVGANGIGKTTLAKELIGLLDIQQGSVSYGKSSKERIKKTSTSLQNCSSMFFYETVEREIIPKHKMKDENYLNKARNYLKELDLWDKRLENPHNLSGGEQQRLALIIALLKDSELIILDEPTAGLDYKRMLQVSEVIKKRAKEVPVILITHDLELLFKVCNTAYLLSKKDSRKINVCGNELIIREFLKLGRGV